MDQIKTGQYIADKRKAQSLTQEQYPSGSEEYVSRMFPYIQSCAIYSALP